MEILFASNNRHKVEEVRSMLPPGFSLLGLQDIHWTTDIPEPFNTYEENAKAKALFVFDRTGLSCFADDSGLEVEALNGRPGVFSARYAGDKRDHGDNIQKVLAELEGISQRKARFVSVIAFISNVNAISIFSGKVEGTITLEPKGTEGFGYDPIFIPDGFDQTFGQLSDEIKNRISHRAQAMQQFLSYLALHR